MLSASLGYITASGRASSEAGYYVLDHCSIAAKSGATGAKGAYYLGRPWGAYARVAVQSSTISEVINAAGWHIWNTGDERTDHVTFGEISNTGAGASGTRKFETKLSKAVAITDVLGSQNIVSGFQPGITTLLTHGPTFRSWNFANVTVHKIELFFHVMRCRKDIKNTVQLT